MRNAIILVFALFSMSFHCDLLKNTSTFSLKLTAKKGCESGFSAERRIENSIDGEYIYEYTGCGPLKFPKLDTASHLPKEVRKLIWYVNLNAGDVQKKKRIYHNQIGEYTCNGFIKDDFNYSVIIEKVEQ